MVTWITFKNWYYTTVRQALQTKSMKGENFWPSKHWFLLLFKTQNKIYEISLIHFLANFARSDFFIVFKNEDSTAEETRSHAKIAVHRKVQKKNEVIIKWRRRIFYFRSGSFTKFSSTDQIVFEKKMMKEASVVFRIYKITLLAGSISKTNNILFAKLLKLKK